MQIDSSQRSHSRSLINENGPPHQRRQRGRPPIEWHDSSSVGSVEDQEQIAWLQRQIRPPGPARKRVVHRERQRNQVVPPVRRRIVELAFQGPGSTARTGMSYAAIARHFCLKYQTVCSIAWRYIANGGHIRLREPGNPRGRSKLTDRHLRWILSQQRLEAWKGRSLAWRATEVERVLGEPITASGLRQLYIRHGVKYRTSRYQFTGNQSPENRERYRRGYSRKLIRYIQGGYEVVYFDETRTSVWDKQRRVWQRPKAPVKCKLSTHRGGVTIFGALSSTQNKLVWETTQGTTTDDVLSFFRQKLLPSVIRPHNTLLVMDNLGSHHHADVQRMLERSGVQVLYTPTGCSDLNPIELVWSQFKQRWRRHLFEHQDRVTGANLEAEVGGVLAELSFNLGCAPKGSFRAMLESLSQ